MKNISNKLFLMVLASLLLLTSCEKHGEDPGAEAPVKLEFDNDGEWTSIDDIQLTVTVAVNQELLSELDVEAVSSNGYTNLLETLSISGGQATLNTTWAELNETAKINASDKSLSGLHFVGTADGVTFRWPFAISQSTPFSLDFKKSVNGEDVEFVTPSEVFNDSVFNVYYEVATVNTTITTVEVFSKIGNASDYNSTPDTTVTVNANSLNEQELDFTVPDESTIALDTNMFVRFVITAENGLTHEEELTIQNVAIGLDYVSSFGLSVAQDEIGYDFSAASALNDSIVNADPDKVDILLDVESNATNIAATAESNTELLVSDQVFGNVTYQSARDEFDDNGGTGVTQIDDIANLANNKAILVKIGDQTGSSQYAVMIITAINRIDDSTVSVDFSLRSRL
ncbi:MAG: hypothetical protein GVY19_05635 [Bacteroidetes bacterium]|nr:hypothetical protein [Bacteroidota bacterium]